MFNKYRIVSKGHRIQVQTRFFWFMWVTYSEETERGTECYVDFVSVEEAERFINNRFKDEPIKVIKYV